MGGCVASKSVTPAALDHSGGLNSVGSGRIRVGGVLVDELESSLKKLKKRGSTNNSSSGGGGGSNYETGSEPGGSGRASSNSSFRLFGNVGRHAEGEAVAAGWPAWLSAVAGEAVHGWVPLKADSFEKLEKIGQGTYSTVFRARDLGTGKIFALKKVRFDNYEPESVRFMAREVAILRRLDHPNVVKLEGLIASRSSCNIYLVFEYMEHDIAGLLSSPEITFTESQVKCYAKQLLSGLEHCHSRGVMHRDIKGANLLVDNEGVLKVADFGLANFCSSYSNNSHRRQQQQPLTSRVVTLWYRPPELLLGSTDYNASVDLWSVGCLLAEFLIGKPILQGRTEVEQLHKIFKLCGSPPEDYWKKTKLPHATLFKPQQPYKSTLWETFEHLPESAVKLIETLLSVEPYRRGTPTTALNSEYFKAKPLACEPSSLPKYPPSKEIDIKHHEEGSRRKHNGRSRGPETRKPARKQQNLIQPIQEESNRVPSYKLDRASVHRPLPKPACNHLGTTKDGSSHVKNASQGDESYVGPLQVSGSSGFAWAKGRTNDALSRSRNRSSSRSLAMESSEALQQSRNKLDSRGDTVKDNQRSMLRQWSQLERPESFDAFEYHSQELSAALYRKEEASTKKINLAYGDDQGEKVEFSGPLLTQTRKIDELLEKHERHIRHAVRRSWFQRVKISGN